MAAIALFIVLSFVMYVTRKVDRKAGAAPKISKPKIAKAQQSEFAQANALGAS